MLNIYLGNLGYYGLYAEYLKEYVLSTLSKEERTEDKDEDVRKHVYDYLQRGNTPHERDMYLLKQIIPSYVLEQIPKRVMEEYRLTDREVANWAKLYAKWEQPPAYDRDKEINSAVDICMKDPELNRACLRRLISLMLKDKKPSANDFINILRKLLKE